MLKELLESALGCRGLESKHPPMETCHNIVWTLVANPELIQNLLAPFSFCWSSRLGIPRLRMTPAIDHVIIRHGHVEPQIMSIHFGVFWRYVQHEMAACTCMPTNR